MSSFKITKRPNTANIDLKHHDEINAKIEQFYQKSGIQVDNFGQLFQALLNYSVTSENQTGIPALKDGEVITTQSHIDDLELICKEKSEEINNLNSTVETLQSEVTTKSDELKTLTENTPSLENVLLVPCTPDQIEVLAGIGLNRLNDKGYSEVDGIPDSPADVIKQLAFREPYLYNHWGNYYTGL